MLGGSSQQVPAIIKAKELGYYTVLIDYLADNPGQFVADKWYQESTTDVEAVYRIAKEERVSGILPYASDPAALPAAIVAERLGLPTNPAKSVEILGIKHKFRNFLHENGFPCPRTFVITPDLSISALREEIKKLHLPIVIKPTDSSGSKGVSFLSDYTTIESAIDLAKTYSRNKILIAEEFIERGFPDVIGGDIFVENGVIILYGDMACLRGENGAGLIPLGERKPNGLTPEQTERLHTDLRRIVEKLGIKCGELNLEVLIDKKDIPHFLELGPRAGGNMIPIQLSDIYNIDLIKANVLAAMGEPTNLIPEEPNDCFMTYVLHSSTEGIFKGINFSNRIAPYIYRKVFYKKEGEAVEVFDGASKALGIVFLRFPDLKAMEMMQKEIENDIKVILE